MSRSNLLSTLHHRARLWIGDQSGASAIMYAALLVPTIMALGVGVDGATLYNSHAKLQTATDQAALAMGVAAAKGTTDIASLQNIGNPYLQSNLGGSSAISNAMISGSPSTNLTNNVLTVSSSASVSTAFMSVFGVSSVPISATTEVKTGAFKNLEVAMVVDNTQSMWTSNNIYALKQAAQNMADILFEGEAVHEKVKMGIVPFVTAVNAGSLAPSLLAPGQTVVTPKNWTGAANTYVAYDANTNTTAQYTGLEKTAYKDNSGNKIQFWVTENTGAEKHTSWAGCLLERSTTNNRDLDDSPPNATNGYWKPYYYIDGKNNNDWKSTSSFSSCSNNSSSDGTTKFCVRRSGINGPSSPGERGPNLACPSPITLLTNTKATIDSAIKNITAVTGGATTGAPGLAWGLRLLSPDFTPIPTGNRGAAWTDTETMKAVVFMTDGDTTVLNGELGAYGYVNDTGVMGGGSNSSKVTWVNNRIATACSLIKAKGITVYTIVFTSGINQATKDIYKNCASSVDKYYYAPSQNDLKASFQAIAFQLGYLRISK